MTRPGLARAHRRCDVYGCGHPVARTFTAFGAPIGQKCRTHAAEVLIALRLASRMVKGGTPFETAIDWAFAYVSRGLK